MNRRRLTLSGALALTLAATWWASTLDEGDGMPSETGDTRVTRDAPAVRTVVSAPMNIAALDAPRPAFAERAPAVFGVPPPPRRRTAARQPPRVVSRPAARAPALPYTYIGSLRETGGKRTLFLLENEQLVTARVGQVLAGRYRIEAVDENAVTLTYLPLNEKQRINLTNPR